LFGIAQEGKKLSTKQPAAVSKPAPFSSMHNSAKRRASALAPNAGTSSLALATGFAFAEIVPQIQLQSGFFQKFSRNPVFGPGRLPRTQSFSSCLQEVRDPPAS